MKTGGGDGESEIWGMAGEGGRGAWRRVAETAVKWDQ